MNAQIDDANAFAFAAAAAYELALTVAGTVADAAVLAGVSGTAEDGVAVEALENRRTVWVAAGLGCALEILAVVVTAEGEQEVVD